MKQSNKLSSSWKQKPKSTTTHKEGSDSLLISLAKVTKIVKRN